MFVGKKYEFRKKEGRGKTINYFDNIDTIDKTHVFFFMVPGLGILPNISFSFCVPSINEVSSTFT